MADFSFPEKLAPMLPDDEGNWPFLEFIFLYGGRGGGKSRGYGSLAVMIIRILRDGRSHRILCCREIQNSIKDSVHKVLKDEIERQGLGKEGTGEFTVTDTEIRHRNGSEIIFRGLFGNLDSIKSMEGLTVVWLEEAQTASQESLDIILPTLRRNKGAQLWASFNPKNEDDPIWKFMQQKQGQPGVFCCEIGLDDNPWAEPALFSDRAEAYRTDPDRAAWIWGGKFYKITDAQVFKGKYSVEAFEPKPHFEGPYFGADFGFSQDPAHAVEAYVGDHCVWVRRSAVALPGTHHIETDYLGGFILSKIPQFASRVSYGDSARPETIGYLQRHEIPKMQACHKWPGCVEDGIAWLRSHSMIIIHPDCPELAEEFRLYSHKIVPRTREILQDIEDKNNHGIDALRYALGPAIRGHKYQQRSKLDFSSGSSLQWG